jgi:tetratricopeptide (TPR) repeat protein
MVVDATWRRPRIIDRYRYLGQRAEQARDFDGAEFYWQRVVAEPKFVTAADRFQLARVAFMQGRSAEGWSLMAGLAPEDAVGYPAAHRAIAIRLAAGADSAEDEFVERLGHHLKAAGSHDDPQPVPKLSTSSATEHDNPQFVMALICHDLWQQEPKRALKRLRSAAERHPELWLATARLERRLGFSKIAEEHLRLAEETLRGKLSHASDDTESRILLASVLAEQERWQAAIELSAELLESRAGPASKRLRALWLELQLGRFDQLTRGDSSVQARIGLLRNLLRDSYFDRAVLERLEELYRQVETTGDRKSIRRLLDDLLASGQAIAAAHLARGNLAVIDGKSDRALWHFQRAFRLAPEMGEAMNNAAWLLFDREPTELQPAMELAERAVETSPADARYRHTLATILLAEERLEEAAEHLETGFAADPTHAPTREALAETYERLGMSGLAAAFRPGG